MTTLYKLTKDIGGYNGFGLPFSDIKYDTVLAAGVEQTLTVPSSAPIGLPLKTNNPWVVLFSYGAGEVWVANNETATVAAAGAFALTDSELRPIAKTVKSGDVLHFICDTATTVNVIFFGYPG